MRNWPLAVRFAALVLSAASIVMGTSLPARADDTPPMINNDSNAKVPTLNVILKSFVDTGSDQINSPGSSLVNGDVRFGGRLTIPFTSPAYPLKNLTIFFEHDNNLHTEGRVTSGGLYDYPGSRYDETDKFSAGYALGNFTIDAGYFYKHRVCCPAASDPTNTRPATEHLAWLGMGDKFGPRRYGMPLFNVQLNGWRSIDHQYGPVSAGHPNLGDLYLYSGSATMSTPLDRHYRIQPYFGVSYSNDYYDNRPVPYYFHTVKMGINSKLSSLVSLQADLSNLSEFNEGYPYAFPNAIHYTLLTLEAVIHIPLRHHNH